LILYQILSRLSIAFSKKVVLFYCGQIKDSTAPPEKKKKR